MKRWLLVFIFVWIPIWKKVFGKRLVVDVHRPSKQTQEGRRKIRNDFQHHRHHVPLFLRLWGGGADDAEEDPTTPSSTTNPQEEDLDKSTTAAEGGGAESESSSKKSEDVLREYVASVDLADENTSSSRPSSTTTPTQQEDHSATTNTTAAEVEAENQTLTEGKEIDESASVLNEEEEGGDVDEQTKGNSIDDPDDDDPDGDDDDNDEERDLEDEELFEMSSDEQEKVVDAVPLGDEDETTLEVDVEIIEDAETAAHVDSTFSNGPRGGALQRSKHASTQPSETDPAHLSSSSLLHIQTSVDEDHADDDSSNNHEHLSPFDAALIQAFLPIIHLPPPLPQTLDSILSSQRLIDAAARRRLDRRTLYHGLLLEFTPRQPSSSHKQTINMHTTAPTRKYLHPTTARDLRAALSLASQPRWRSHLLVPPRHIHEQHLDIHPHDPQIHDQTNNKDTQDDDDDDDNHDKHEQQLKNKPHNKHTRENSSSEASSPTQSEPAVPWWWRGGVRLYETDDEIQAARPDSPFPSGPNPSGGPAGFFGFGQSSSSSMEQDDDDDTDNHDDTNAAGLAAIIGAAAAGTLGMQETVAMALAHSLKCGLALIDDAALLSVRQAVLDYDRNNLSSSLGLTSDSPELRPTALLGHLIRLANDGWFPQITKDAPTSARISHHMEHDMALGLDDVNDDLAVESIRLMKEDEKEWFDDITTDADADAETPPTTEPIKKGKPLPLILFLRSAASQSILRSKSAIECLARESVSEDSIHMLVMGKGIDASTVPLLAGGANDGKKGPGVPRRISPRHPSSPQGTGGTNPFLNFDPSQQRPNPFGGLPNSPSGANASPGFGPMMGFGQQNINASGVNDPEGSRRFNIFLARTVDENGNPGIMGAIAPPQVGNLFPRMLEMKARENMMRQQQQQQQDGNSDTDNNNNNKQSMNPTERWNEMMQNQMMNFNGQGVPLPPPQFFNASITSPWGFGTTSPQSRGENSDDEDSVEGYNNGNHPPNAEMIQRAIQAAMSNIVDRLSRGENDGASGYDNGSSSPLNGLPPDLAKAFSQVLSNEHLRRGIAENLARAAPALVDPRCQGVMLSVYVPPGPDHPNRGMMPGQQHQQQQRSSKQQGSDKSKLTGSGGRQPSSSSSQVQRNPGTNNPMGSWLNKILSSSSSGTLPSSTNDDVEESDPLTDNGDADRDIEDEDSAKTGSSSSESTEAETKGDSSSKTPSSRRSRGRARGDNTTSRRDRVRNLAAAAAVVAANPGSRNGSATGDSPSPRMTQEQKAQRHLTRLQSLCRPIPLAMPSDPVRSKSWESWALREYGAIVFRKNRDALNAELAHRKLRLRINTGTVGMGSILRQMMSVRDIGDEMEEIVKCAVEIEAARSQRMQESPWESEDNDSSATSATIDRSLEQLLAGDNFQNAMEGDGPTKKAKSQMKRDSVSVQYIHPASIESALSLTCRINPSPSGVSSISNASPGAGASSSAYHRTKEEIMALAQDKHERALVANVVSPQDIGVSYDMIGGLSDVKELLRQSITYPLKFPHLYSEGIAREAVKGVLLFGPPGTGKTMLAKAVATEGGATFLSVDASSVENKWLGESEKNAKAVFTLARRLAPCVIFLDEVDSMLSSREGSSDDSAHGTLTSVKTTMMSEWDGLNSGTNGRGGEAGSDRVIVIGSTNRPFDLDEAVLRRFPRRILVDLPNLETRKEILEVTLAENRLGSDVNLTKIAEKLDGYTGSDIKEVCREAVVQISHEQARMLDQGFFEPDENKENDETKSESTTTVSSSTKGFLQMLRPVTMKDFEKAMGKLKRSVSEKGRELARVWEWNDEYGEIKKKDKKDYLPQLMNMYL